MSRTLLLVAALLAVGVAVFLVVSRDADEDARLDGGLARAEGEGFLPGDPLQLDGESDPAAAELEGRRGARTGRGATDAPSTPAKRGPVLVRVLDADGVPLGGRWVSVWVGDDLVAMTRAGADGVVRFDDLPLDGSAWLAVGQHPSRPDDVVAVTGGEVRVTGKNVVPLEVRAVDRETGSLLGHVTWRPKGTGDAVEGARSGEPLPVAARPGRPLTQPFVLDPGRGYVDAEGPWTTRISRYATRLVAVQPLSREAQVSVVPVDAEGEEVRDANVHAFRVGTYVDASPQTDGWMLGAIPLRGVPFLAGETLEIHAATPEGLAGSATATLPATAMETLDVDVLLRPGAPTDVTLDRRVLPWTPDPWLGDPWDGGGAPAGAPDALVGGLEVEVRRADGTPAVGVHVDVPADGVYRTNADGVILLEKVLEGERQVRLAEPGLLPVAATVVVVAGQVQHVTLREPEGGMLLAEVKDEGGRPLAFARLQVEMASGLEWIDLARDGTQRLDPFVDEKGQRLLQRVEPGRVKIRGWWGRRSGAVEATVRERETEGVTLILKAPRDD